MTDHRSQLLSTLETQQREAWRRGQKLFIEAFIERHPDLSGDDESLLYLIEREFHLRREAGEDPQSEDYCQRFPHLAEKLRSALGPISDQHNVATKTAPNDGQKTRSIVCPFCSTNINTDSTVARVQCDNCGKQVHVLDETQPLRVGTGVRLGSFELLTRVGAGQYGEVWRARDVTLRRDVALKIPHTRDADPETIDLFQREARAIARIDHPNILAVYEVGNDDGLPYIVTEFIDGTNLKALLKAKRFTAEDAAQLSATLAAALHKAHLAGVVHRDLKPGNILIDKRGAPHIADFGLAKHFSLDEVTITTEGDVVGTLAYMSPEQALGRSNEATPASDIYSLGVVLYELLTRKCPFEGEFQVVRQCIISEPPRPPRAIDPSVPHDLETICLKAMSKLPAERYSDAQAMADDLDRYLRGDLIHARRATLLEKSVRWTRRNWMKAGSVALLAGGTGVAAAAFSNWRKNGSSLPPHLLPRRVRITTEPVGAKVAFIPLDQRTGRPQPESSQFADTKTSSPWAQANLIPGDYLVVAEIQGFGFHEVWRHVPESDKEVIWKHPHKRWKMAEEKRNIVELPRVKVPDGKRFANMCELQGSDRFVMGRSGMAGAELPHARTIPPFALDFTEVTVGEYRQHRIKAPAQIASQAVAALMGDDCPVTFVSFDEATYYAELLGKRLPDEAEFEFAATNGGRTRYPWGDEAPAEAAWQFGAVGSTDFDRSASLLALVGLCSNVAEWALPVFPIDEDSPQAPKFSMLLQGTHCVRGGNSAVMQGNAAAGSWERLPYSAIMTRDNSWLPGLGFRCARSARPRLSAGDFSRVLDP